MKNKVKVYFILSFVTMKLFFLLITVLKVSGHDAYKVVINQKLPFEKSEDLKFENASFFENPRRGDTPPILQKDYIHRGPLRQMFPIPKQRKDVSLQESGISFILR